MKSRRLVVIVAGILGVLGGIAAAAVADSGHPANVVVFPTLLLPLVLWKRQSVGVILVLAIAVVVEQVNYTVAPGVSGAFTQNIPMFHSVTQGSGINPAEILLGMILLVWLMKAALDGTLNVPHTGLSRSIMALLALVVVGLGVGLAHGGQSRWAFWEIRPWFYLAIMYWLSASLITTKRTLRAVLWTLVLGSGFKAILGLRIWISARHVTPRPGAILSHEEAFFFGVFIFLTLGLWIFEQRGPLRTTASCLLPIVLTANLANTRRNAWAILALGLLVMMVLAYRSLPHRRQMLRRLVLGLLVACAVYLPAFWNNGGIVGQPAHTLHSEISPDSRDESSDLYRTQEDANLLFNIRKFDDLGEGFGVPIDYALPIVNVSTTDPSIVYVPHNGILYLWMRLGIQGLVVFLLMIAAAIIRAAQLTKVEDKELALFGTVVICAIVAYLVQGYNDMGFTWFRIALCMGVLLGATEAALRMARTTQSLVEATR